MTALRALADPRRGTPGACAICGAAAASWHRTGLAAGGLVRAARACSDHESEVVSALHALTLDECVALVPRARRRAAAAAAVRRADRLDGASSRHARTSAALRGASSATHTHALLAGAASRESQALRAFADALLIEAESEVAL